MTLIISGKSAADSLKIQPQILRHRQSPSILNPLTMKPHRGILLVNLGSPDSCSVPAVRRYLREFLMDERVIDTNPILRWIIVNCFVLPRRPHNTAHAYRQVWTDEGSPLMASSQKLRSLLQQQTSLPVALGMRYGNPSIRSALTSLRAQHPGLEEILLIPLYPHYAMATWETVVIKAREELAALDWQIPLISLPPFYRQPNYLDALANSIREQLPARYDHLLFSYHGVPLRHLQQQDPTHSHPPDQHECCQTPSPARATCYRHQCRVTTTLTAELLGLPDGKYSTSFQSRFGKEPWCQPYTDLELICLANNGVKHLAVVCPAFVTDCLETLEEIGMTGKASFLANGGESFHLIPCLNEHPQWVAALRDWSENFPRNWQGEF